MTSRRDIGRHVEDRAVGRCEYCRMHQSLQGATFHVEHVIPRSRGGPSELDNLAWACPGCNLHKANRTDVIDPDTGDQVLLSNPRIDDWDGHFRWDDYRIVGQTPIGRATAAALELNHPRRVQIRHFLAHMDHAKPLLDQRYGSNWLVIPLIDELDTAISKLSDDQFFQNLRNLSMISRFHRHFRLIASGVREMSDLISSGASPLNHRRNRHLGILTGTQARQLIAFGFPEGLHPEVESSLFQLTGRHPYVLQGILEHLWEDQGELDRQAVMRAAREFLD